jgi:3-phosphoshikimate 1-carboxyvinyltransferase
VIAPFDAEVTPPGSKSLTNRMMLLAALADGVSRIRRPLLVADDAERMLAAVIRLGASVERLPGGDVKIGGVSGRWSPPAGVHGSGPEAVVLDIGDSGTCGRFLAAAAVLSPVPVAIDGSARMRERPMSEVLDAITGLGARVDYLGLPGRLPVRIIPPETLPRATTLTIPAMRSSQVVSALLLIAPWLPGGLTVQLPGEVMSRSYVHMTVSLLDRLGATVRTSDNLRVIRVFAGSEAAGEPFPRFDCTVEPDASGATYFWAAAAMNPGSSARVPGLGRQSLQGDAVFPGLLERMGAHVVWEDDATIVRGPSALKPVLADLSDMPDAAMTLAAAACFASGSSVLHGLRTLRHKESDRLKALKTELGRVGVEVRVHPDDDAITLMPPPGGVDTSRAALPVEFRSYDDHRMAMSLSLIGLRRPNVSIRDPGCVGKTYPGFWADLARCLGR